MGWTSQSCKHKQRWETIFQQRKIPYCIKYLDTLISEYRKIRKTNKAELAKKLAVILENINYLHPFREGNGRTQREFLRILALEKGLHINLNPPDNKNVYERYMKGTIESDIGELSELILELIEK